MPQHRPLQQHLLVPIHDLSNEAPEIVMLQELQVLWSRMRFRHQLDLQIGGWKFASANSSMSDSALLRVEDAVYRIGPWFNDLGRRIPLEVA